MEIQSYNMSREQLEHALNSHTTMVLEFLKETGYITETERQQLNENAITVLSKKGWWSKVLDKVLFKDDSKDIIMLILARKNLMKVTDQVIQTENK